MKPFSLTAVLKYRKQLEESAATKLAKAQREMHQAKRELQKVTDEHDNLVSELGKYQISGMEIEYLLQFENRISWLKVQKQEKNIVLNAAIENVDKNRLNVIKKSRNKKVLEQLKQRQNQEWKSHVNKKENNQLDEIAVLSHERKQNK